MRSCGRKLEEYAQYVYRMLLNLRDENIEVEHNVSILGRSGAKHQIDVYYEFERAAVKHRVAIECKNENRAVHKGEVQEFHSKISDIGDITGIMISKNGYQKGARDFAAFYDILAITEEDLPTINMLVGDRLQSVLLPSESYIGEPFWTIMETRDDQVTGSYLTCPVQREKDEEFIPLFISKVHAQKYAQCYPKEEKWVVRGLPQHSLRVLTEILIIGRKSKKTAFMLIYDVPNNPKNGVLGIVKSAEEIQKDFIQNDN